MYIVILVIEGKVVGVHISDDVTPLLNSNVMYDGKVYSILNKEIISKSEYELDVVVCYLVSDKLSNQEWNIHGGAPTWKI